MIPPLCSSISFVQIRWARPPATVRDPLHPLGFGPPRRQCGSVVASICRHSSTGMPCTAWPLPPLAERHGVARSGHGWRRLATRDGSLTEAIVRQMWEEQPTIGGEPEGSKIIISFEHQDGSVVDLGLELRLAVKKSKAEKDPNKLKDTFRKEYKEKNPNVKQLSVIGKAGGEKWKYLSDVVNGTSVVGRTLLTTSSHVEEHVSWYPRVASCYACRVCNICDCVEFLWLNWYARLGDCAECNICDWVKFEVPVYVRLDG